MIKIELLPLAGIAIEGIGKISLGQAKPDVKLLLGKEFIFEDMPDNTNIEEYLLYCNRFKKDAIYEHSEQILADNLSALTTTLGRHWRNLDKQPHTTDD